MFMSVVSQTRHSTIYSELAGTRVLVTGLTPTLGADIAGAFADHKAQIVLQTASQTPEITELSAHLSRSATDVRLFPAPTETGDAAVKLAQSAAQAVGGLDTVVNLVSVSQSDMIGRSSVAEIEDLVCEKLTAATLIGRVAANRMRLTWVKGLVLNVVALPKATSDAEAALGSFFRSAIATLTRREAESWAGDEIRFNAVAPRGLAGDGAGGACLTSEPDIAALALYLASRKGRQLSGHVFDAEGIAARGC